MNTFAGETYLIKRSGLNNSPVILHKSKAQTTNPRGAVRVAGAVRGEQLPTGQNTGLLLARVTYSSANIHTH